MSMREEFDMLRQGLKDRRKATQRLRMEYTYKVFRSLLNVMIREVDDYYYTLEACKRYRVMFYPYSGWF